MRVFVYEHLCSGALADQPGAESLRREGLAMLSAVLADLARCPGVCSLTLSEPSLADLLQTHHPSCEILTVQGDEESLFRQLARQADFVLVIAPEFDDLLLHRCQWVLSEGSQLLGPSPEAVRLTGDKLTLANHLTHFAVPTPLTRLVDDWSDWSAPLVCKPRQGAGSQFTALIQDRDQLLAHRLMVSQEGGPGEDLLLQLYHPGQPISVAFLAGPAACLPLPAAEQCLAQNGSFTYLGGRLPLPLPLQDRAIRLATRAFQAVPGLAGYFGMDLILAGPADGSEDVVIEINPRLTTSYVGLRRLAQHNLMQTLLAVACGQSPGPLAWRDEVISFHADGRVD